jgi:predicted PolB exonuclease-like 3'-5' exonuclease
MKAFDIETIPNMAMVDCLPEPEPAANIKDPEKIAADVQKKKAKQVDTMALSPMFGRICAFSWYGSDGYGCDVMKEVSEAEEIRLVESALTHFTITNDTAPSIITWNGNAFDLPFLIKRAMLLRVAVPSGFPGLSYFTKRYSHVPHCDMMQELAGWGQQTTSLDVAAKVILGKQKPEHDFTQFAKQITCGDGEQIGLYCLNDSEMTYEIYVRASPYLW